ncbi:hypothetical protein BN2497_3249 [Janthinobacterium sp. CG23_2]|nr:hypothetical protein BN2497_3249 [Janthinobacterium sp. CG23_2]CUU28022.1 hypothetical protein BN3177_3249 [Janthinobacterium sp. CG23_2]
MVGALGADQLQACGRAGVLDHAGVGAVGRNGTHRHCGRENRHGHP